MWSLLDRFVDLLARQGCAGCDEAVGGSSVFCPMCSALAEVASDPHAVFEYGGPVAVAVQRLKYEGRSELGAVLGSLMVKRARRWIGEVDAVVPVPLHWRRRRVRGYDQAALLARPVAKALSVPLLFRGLRRVRNTQTQVGLLRGERYQNIVGAFAAGRLQRVGRVLLVDDVRTSGSTLQAASEALKSGGVREVHTLVLAARVLGTAP